MNKQSSCQLFSYFFLYETIALGTAVEWSLKCVVLVLRLLDIYGYSVHKMFRHKAQRADNGYSLGKCCNAVTGHLVNALRVSFSVSLAVLGLLTRGWPLPARPALPVTLKN
jgi:hypothetical protein